MRTPVMKTIAFIFTILSSCQYYNGKLPITKLQEDSIEISQTNSVTPPSDSIVKLASDTLKIYTGTTTPEQLLAFGKTLIGTPYLYGSTNPVKGFDCSGFITYVFNHFNIKVPRSSIGFTNYQTQVELGSAKVGDLILFTGTDSIIREVGHMGIIASVKNDEVEFIHSTSGRANGVTITPLNKYYLGRFVKVLRIF